MYDIKRLINSNVDAEAVINAVLFNYDTYSILADNRQDTNFIIESLIEKYHVETNLIRSYREPYYAQESYYDVLVLKLKDRYFKVTKERVGDIFSKASYINWKEVSRKVTTKTIEVIEYI